MAYLDLIIGAALLVLGAVNALQVTAVRPQYVSKGA